MKKIVVVSDTHGNISCLEKILDIMKESDYVFHLGDFQRDILQYSKELADKIVSVKGNCDGGGDYQIFQVEKLKSLLVHGDRYCVKDSLDKLYYLANELSVDVVFYGHTHIASIKKIDNIWFINPGCMSSFAQKSYCYVVIFENKIVAKLVNI